MIYPSIYAGPPRWYGSTRTVKKYIAIHNTSNDATAEGEASYARRREDRVSSQYYCDNNSLLQSLDTALRAYHAGSSTGNSLAIAYEITGTNSKTRAWWLANVAWPLLARQIAADCREFGIAARLLTVAEIKAGKLTGIITHDQMRQAWGGTTHTDPGPNFPLDHLLALVQAELNGDDMPTPEEYAKAVWTYNSGSSLNPVQTLTLLRQAAATSTALLPKLDSILAEASDDGTVVLDAAGLAAVREIRDMVAALPTAEQTADAVADEQAERLTT